MVVLFRADPGLKKGGGSNIFDVGPMPSYVACLKYGAGCCTHVNPPSFVGETPSFWRLKSLSFEGHLEEKK